MAVHWFCNPVMAVRFCRGAPSFYPGCSVMVTQVRIQPMKVRFLPPGLLNASLAQLDQSTGLRSRGPGVRVSQDAPKTVDNILQLLYNQNLNERLYEANS